MNTDERFDEFFAAYVEAALWSTTNPDDESEESLEHYDLNPAFEETLRTEVRVFFDAHKDTIESAETKSNYGNFKQAGHDLWLNSNGHGCGFWDGDWMGEAADILDKAAREFGGMNLFVNEDGLVDRM